MIDIEVGDALYVRSIFDNGSKLLSSGYYFSELIKKLLKQAFHFDV